MTLIFNEPDVTRMRLSFYNIWIRVRHEVSEALSISRYWYSMHLRHHGSRGYILDQLTQVIPEKLAFEKRHGRVGPSRFANQGF